MSSYFKWEPSYDLGIQKMNAEHQDLIDLMQDLYQAHESKINSVELKRKLDALRDYTVKHFMDEEEFMEQVGYPKLATHKIIHQNLINTFNEYYEQFEHSHALTESFFKFLQLWLSAHIRGIDMQYAEFNKQKEKKTA